jgi:hypothetical protein
LCPGDLADAFIAFPCMCDWFKLLSQFEIVSLKGILTETVKEYFGIIEKQNIYDKRFIGNCYSIILFN